MKVHQIIFLIFLLLVSACYREEDYNLSQLEDDIISLTFTSDTLLADGASNTDVIVEIPLESQSELSKIKITTSNGVFENGQKEIEVNASFAVSNGVDKKIAKVRLISTQKVENAVVEAKIGDISKSKILPFKKAYPEEIETELPALTITYGYQTTSLKIKLSRSFGKPSINTKANVRAVDSLGAALGQFLNYNDNADENGMVINLFSLGIDSCYCTKVYFISETLRDETTTIKDTTSMIIQ